MLHGWLPLGALHEQMQQLAKATGSRKIKDQAAVMAWADLVRGHALDFFADAGQDGAQWQLAVMDAWETWLLLRESQDKATVDAWPWSWGNAQFQARGTLETQAPVDVELMMFGGQQETWKRIDLVDWRRGLARLEDAQACHDALALLQVWPRTDMPSLAMAIGAMWAIGVVGRVAGVQSLEIGGCRGKERLILTSWSSDFV